MNKLIRLLEKVLFRKKKTFLDYQKELSKTAFEGFLIGMRK